MFTIKTQSYKGTETLEDIVATEQSSKKINKFQAIEYKVNTMKIVTLQCHF